MKCEIKNLKYRIRISNHVRCESEVPESPEEDYQVFGKVICLNIHYGGTEIRKSETNENEFTITTASGQLRINAEKSSWTSESLIICGSATFEGAWNALVSDMDWFCEKNWMDSVYNIESSWELTDQEYKLFRKNLFFTGYGERLKSNKLYPNEVCINKQFIIRRSLAEEALRFNNLTELSFLTPKKVARYLVSIA